MQWKTRGILEEWRFRSIELNIAGNSRIILEGKYIDKHSTHSRTEFYRNFLKNS